MPIAVSRGQPKRLLSDTRRHTSRFFGGGYFPKYVEHPVAVTLSIASRLPAARGRSVFGRIATGYIAFSSTPNEKEIFLTTSASDVLPSNVQQRDVTVRLRWSNNEQREASRSRQDYHHPAFTLLRLSFVFSCSTTVAKSAFTITPYPYKPLFTSC